MIVSTTDIQNNFGKYLKLSKYEEVIITKNGKKTAKLVTYTEKESEGRWLVGEGSPSYRPDGIRFTYEKYLKIVEESENRYEYIDGEIFLLASPLYPHQKAVKEIILQFGQWFQNKACEPLVSPFDVTLFRLENEEKVNVVQPDILVICDPENIDELGKYTGVPTLVVEVLSDSTRSRDLVKKLDLYMESGIKEYWVINTSSAEIYIYAFVNNMIDKILAFKRDDIAESVTFPGLRVALKPVFISI
jgi:prevent-host-death family protein